MSDDQGLPERSTPMAQLGDAPVDSDESRPYGVREFNREFPRMPDDPPEERRREESSFFDSFIWKMMRDNSNNG